ncbi:hypothetical protein MAR_012052 [Mya arenaria]|uniref:Uncharacterized protein n=1 Tax=Mya arenaria TaxID=6604 RepID=A0ABY7FZM1_MYAAR|nr:hypothetical protein MAR_012052 [Mya arenaria]
MFNYRGFVTNNCVQCNFMADGVIGQLGRSAMLHVRTATSSACAHVLTLHLHMEETPAEETASRCFNVHCLHVHVLVTLNTSFKKRKDNQTVRFKKHKNQLFFKPIVSFVAWSAWFDGDCSVTCGVGTMSRLRFCSSGHDEDCLGSPFDSYSCTKPGC